LERRISRRRTRFFAGLFGWAANEGPPEAGGYVIYSLDGVPVAGAGPLTMEVQPAVWTSYFSTADADATAAVVEEAGGKVLMAPMDVPGTGRMGLFTDLNGAVFGAWQPIPFAGAGLANEPSTVAWNELMARDIESSAEFYQSVFGLDAKPSASSGDTPYTEFQIDGSAVAGMISMDGPEWPADLPPHWMVYFAVADTDAACAKATDLGGSVSVPPTDAQIGRFAVVADPNGAFFSLVALAQ